MFLFDPTFGSSFENCEQEIRRLMDRAEGEIILCRKWDERRLAYRIKGRKRGVYVLAYLRVKPEKIVPLERDVKLSEIVLRMLILKAEGVTREAMEQAFVLWDDEPPRSDDRGGGRSGGSEAPKDSGTGETKTAPVAAPAATAVAEPVQAEPKTAEAESSDEQTTTE